MTHVLVVDDDIELRGELSSFFKSHGYEVACAENGYQALDQIKIRMPDAMLVDIRMPGMSGEEFIKAITPVNAEDPVVFCMTGYSDFSIGDAYKFGASGFFTKPFDPSDVMGAINAALSFREKVNGALDHGKKMDHFITSHRGLIEVGMKAAVTTHEMRNQLQMLTGFHHLLTRELDTNNIEKAKALVEKAHIPIMNMGRILNESLLDVAQQKSIDVSLNAILNRCIGYLRPTIEEMGIELRLLVPSEELVLNGVPHKIEQVIINLVRNSADALGSTDVAHKEIIVSLTYKGQLAEISISDNGIGIAKEIKEHLFEYLQTTKGKKGTGIGLALSRLFVRSHGGDIFIKNEVNPTIFSIQLPIKVNKPLA